VRDEDMRGKDVRAVMNEPHPGEIPLIDTHTHLCDPVFDPDRNRVLDRARKAYHWTCISRDLMNAAERAPVMLTGREAAVQELKLASLSDRIRTIFQELLHIRYEEERTIPLSRFQSVCHLLILEILEEDSVFLFGLSRTRALRRNIKSV